MKAKRFEFVGGKMCGQYAEMHPRTKSLYDERFGWYFVGPDGRLWHNDKMTQESERMREKFRGEQSE